MIGIRELEPESDNAQAGDGRSSATDGQVRRFTRLEAVQLQLEMAVRAFLQFDDLVSALTLAGATETVLSDLQPEDGLFGVDAWSIRAFCNLHIKPEHHKDAWGLFHKKYNMLKHADRDAQTDHKIDEITVLLWILISIHAFLALGGRTTSVLNAFKVWLALARPDWFTDTEPVIMNALSTARSTFVQMGKPQAFEAIQSALTYKSLFPNPKSPTEQPLP